MICLREKTFESVPKGRKILAPCVSAGLLAHGIPQALKGRQTAVFSVAPPGLVNQVVLLPRASHGANVFRPFRGLDWQDLLHL